MTIKIFSQKKLSFSLQIEKSDLSLQCNHNAKTNNKKQKAKNTTNNKNQKPKNKLTN